MYSMVQDSKEGSPNNSTYKQDGELLPICGIICLVYADFLEHSLLRDGTSELHVAAMQAMLEVAAEDTAAFALEYISRVGFLRSFLSHTDDEGVPCQ